MKITLRRWMITLSTLLLSLSLLVLSGCSPSPEEQKNTAIVLIDKANPQVFVRHIVSEYLTLSDELVMQYQRYKAEDDAHGFILFRNNHWTPAYIDSKRGYDKTLFNQKAYIYRHQLNGVFDTFFELQQLSILLKHSLLNQDWHLEQQALQRISEDRLIMMKYLKTE
ncbi:hypothetical protein Q4488_04780 [Amphritea sp. 1_MG-2023]|uniref:hypothetical protein n=1 Tax=Amphritea sp. 1_MG-2023 TaxID=3062670 RepID=UPI0026E163D4|nr:hypothetical protein [Amphritea sp. 1_MG-2023]MDO6562692.1 hypothetical protein [Amphritea sp. 1_MG-2023]